MGLLQRLALYPDERLETQDARAIEAFAANDWRYFLLTFFGAKSMILSGFDIVNYQSIFSSQQFLLQLSDVALMHTQATGQGVGFYAPSGSEQDLAVPLSAASINYIECDLITEAASPDVRSLWDQSANDGSGEDYTATLRTVINLELDVTSNTTGFTPGKMPVYKVVTNASGYVVSVQDCRNMLFRLGTGGNNPNPANSYSWPSFPDAAHSRLEPSGTSASASAPAPWQGADKNFRSYKDLLDAIVSILKETNNVPFWYMKNQAGGVAGAYQNSALTMLTGGKWQHIQGSLGHLALVGGSTIRTLGKAHAQSIAAWANVDLTTNSSLYVLFPNADAGVAYVMGQDGATPIQPKAATQIAPGSITVQTGGNYPTGGGTLMIHGVPVAYTAYDAVGGVFSGLSLDVTVCAQSGDFVYMLDAGGTGYVHASPAANVPGVSNGVSMGAERVLWLAYYPGGDVMFFRNGFAHQGEEIDVGDDADTTAQDKNVAYIAQNVTSITSTTTSGNQVVTFQGSGPVLRLALPGAPGGSLGLGGSLTLGQNQCAWITAPDRDAAFSLASLANATVGPIGSAPIDYNTFVIAYRLNDSNVYLWDRQKYRPGVNGANFHKYQVYLSPQGDDFNGDGTQGNPVASWTKANVLATNLGPNASQPVTIIGDAAPYVEAPGFSLLSFCQYVVLGLQNAATVSVASGNITWSPAPGGITTVVGINFTSPLVLTDTNTGGFQALLFYGANANAGVTENSNSGAFTAFWLQNGSSANAITLVGVNAHLFTDCSSAPSRSSITFSGGATLGANVSLTENASAINNDSLFRGFAVSDALNGIWGGVLAIIPPALDYTTTIPGSPGSGDRYIVGPSASGAWSGQDGNIATWNGSAWTFDAACPVGGIALIIGQANTFFKKVSATAWSTLVPPAAAAGKFVKPASGFRVVGYDAFPVNKTDPTSLVLSTNAAYDSVNKLYRMQCAKGLTVTTSGTGFTLSGAPAYGAQPGDIIYSASQQQFRTIATISGSTGTLDSSFGTTISPVNLASDSCMVSQALFTKELTSRGDPSHLTRPADIFPSTAVNVVHVNYEDSIGSGDTQFTPPAAPAVVVSGTNSGATGAGQPQSVQYTGPFARPAAPARVPDYPLNAPQATYTQTAGSIYDGNGTFAASFALGDGSFLASSQGVASQFTVDVGGATVTDVDLALAFITGAPFTSGTITVSIVNDSSGTPGGTTYFTRTIAASAVTNSPGSGGNTFHYPSLSVALAAGQYWMVVEADSTYVSQANSAKFIEVGTSTTTSTNGITGIQTKKFNGSVWGTVSTSNQVGPSVTGITTVVTPAAPPDALFLCYFPNPTNGSVTSAANLLEYQASLYQGPTSQLGDVEQISEYFYLQRTEGQPATKTLAPVSNAVTVDGNAGKSFYFPIAANTTVTLANPRDGETLKVIVDAQGSAHAVAFTGGIVKWVGGSQPSQSANADLYELTYYASAGVYYASVTQNYH